LQTLTDLSNQNVVDAQARCEEVIAFIAK
jgi:hypothetical protein